MTETLRESRPLASMPSARGIRLILPAPAGKMDLRGDPDDREFLAAVGRSLDLVLPTEPLTSAVRGEVMALWLGPDRWLIVCPLQDVNLYGGAIRRALGTTPAALTEISDGLVHFRLDGPNALDVLAKGCPLDLDPRIFKPGRVASSLLAKAAVVLHHRHRGSYDIHVGRSYAGYLLAWLEEAGLEYGVLIDQPT